MRKTPTLAEQIGRACVHFTGVGCNTCKAGVKYETVTVRGQGVRGFPCLRDGEHLPCDKRRFPTPEEVAEQVEDHDRSWKQLREAMSSVYEDARKHGFKKGNGGTGFVPCPVCKQGDLHYSVSGYNGHVHGRCNTKGCVSWMQ